MRLQRGGVLSRGRDTAISGSVFSRRLGGTLSAIRSRTSVSGRCATARFTIGEDSLRALAPCVVD